MPPASCDHVAAATPKKDRKQSSSLAEYLEAHPGPALAIFTLVYAVAEFCANVRRPFWFDELICYYLAGLPSLRDIWPLIARGIELNPPLPFWITWVVHHTLGQGEFLTRLPALAGFWLLCICLYFFVRRRSDVLHGLMTMMLPVFTYSGTHATWARGYGLMLGSAAAALLCWQLATEGIRRSLTVPALAVSIAVTVSCHYYALYVAGALAMGELVRTLHRRRIDLPVWMAFVLAVSPLLAYLPALRTVSSASHNFWITPMPRFLYESYADLLGSVTLVLLLGLALTLGDRDESKSGRSARAGGLPRHEIAVCLVLIAMPAAIYAGAIVSPLAFFSRYVQPVVIGFAIVLAMFTYRVGGTSRQFRRRLAVLLVGLCFVPWALLQVLKPFFWPPPQDPIRLWIPVQRASAILPVVVDNENDFLTLFHYAPTALRSRLYFLLDSPSAIEYLGSDTGQRSLRLLETFHDVHAVDYHVFTASHPEFLVARSHPEGWVTQTLLHDGAKLDLIRLDREQGFYVEDRLLFHVTLPRRSGPNARGYPPTVSRAPEQPGGVQEHVSREGSGTTPGNAGKRFRAAS